MTNYERIKAMSLEEMTDLLSPLMSNDDTEPIKYFAENYCEGCGEHCLFDGECNKVDDYTDKNIIRLWLESEV